MEPELFKFSAWFFQQKNSTAVKCKLYKNCSLESVNFFLNVKLRIKEEVVLKIWVFETGYVSRLYDAIVENVWCNFYN